MRIAVLPLLLLLTLGLGACSNEVRSDRPLFTAADTEGLSKFKEGLWAQLEDGCQADLSREPPAWPECASAMVFGPRGLDAVYDEGRLVPRDRALPYDFLVAAGDPMVVQYISKHRTPGETYHYWAVGPRERDTDGAVTGFVLWPVICGPPPPEPPPRADGAPAATGVTLAPWPGLEVKDSNCFARDAGAVRFAAKASEEFRTSTPTTPIRWVRAGRR